MNINGISRGIYYKFLAEVDPSAEEFYNILNDVDRLYYWYFKWKYDPAIRISEWEIAYLTTRLEIRDFLPVSRLCVLMIQGETGKVIGELSDEELELWLGWYYEYFLDQRFERYLCDYEINMLTRPALALEGLPVINYIIYLSKYREEFSKQIRVLDGVCFVYGWLLSQAMSDETPVKVRIIENLKYFFLSNCEFVDTKTIPAYVLFRSIFDGMSMNDVLTIGNEAISTRMNHYIVSDPHLNEYAHGYLLDNGVALVGMVTGVLGIGEDVRQTYKALTKNGLNSTLFTYPKKIVSPNNNAEFYQTESYIRFNKVIINLTGPEIIRLHSTYGEAFFDQRYVIGYLPSELSVFPDEMDDVIDILDEIWCPSEFIKKSIDSKSNKPVLTMGLSMDYQELRTTHEFNEFDCAGKYKILIMFDSLSYVDRKAPLDAVHAFKIAFSDSADVVLIVKTMNYEKVQNEFPQLIKECESASNIVFINDVYDREMTLDLINSVDCYMSLHRAEGFGRVVAESMYFQKDVIVSDYSGNQDYCNSDTALLVNGTLREIEEHEYPFYKGQSWFHADVDSAVKQLIYAFENRNSEASIQRRKIASELVRNRYSHESMGKKMRDRILEIEKSIRTKSNKVPFDSDFYKTYYPDIGSNDNKDLLHHYVSHGFKEGRASSYNDLNIINKYKQNYLGHSNSKKICVIIHSFYEEVVADIAGYLKNISKYEFDVFVNVPETVANASHLDLINGLMRPKKIFISPNAGRDIAGMLKIGKEINPDEYDIALILHTKSSPQNNVDYVDKWKRDLFDPLLGSRRKVSKIIETLRLNRCVWGAAAALQWKSVCLNDNDYYVRKLFELYEITNDDMYLEYVSGTMMYMDVRVLKRLSSRLDFKDFEVCDGKSKEFFIDGQLEHAVERIIGAVLRSSNQKIMWLE